MKIIFTLLLLLQASYVCSMQKPEEMTYKSLPVEILYKNAQDQILSDIAKADILPKLKKTWTTSLAEFAQIDRQHRDIVNKVKEIGGFVYRTYNAKEKAILQNIQNELNKSGYKYAGFNVLKDGVDVRNVTKATTIPQSTIGGGTTRRILPASNKTLLMLAAEANDKNIVKLLIDNGADVNLEDMKGNTALTLTTDPKVAKLLRDRGAK